MIIVILEIDSIVIIQPIEAYSVFVAFSACIRRLGKFGHGKGTWALFREIKGSQFKFICYECGNNSQNNFFVGILLDPK